jgi:hypothetical protein
MIQKGSNVVLLTNTENYSPCMVMAINKDNITISYVSEVKRDKRTGQMIAKRAVKTIQRKHIRSISERL